MGVEDRTKKAIQGTALDPEAPHAPLPKGGQRKQQRTRRVPLLLSPAEFEMFSNAAKQAGDLGLGPWIRSVLYQHVRMRT